MWRWSLQRDVLRRGSGVRLGELRELVSVRCRVRRHHERVSGDDGVLARCARTGLLHRYRCAERPLRFRRRAAVQELLMRTPTLAAVLIASFAISCFIDRPSEELTCGTTADCAGLSDRHQCMSGYCLVPNCPPSCTSCNETAMTCQVDCTTEAACAGPITCPMGWTCTVSCVGGGACQDVECENGASCDITCSGAGACGAIQCASACACDVACAAGACTSMACPERGGGGNQVQCTVDGLAGTECDSARDSRCARC